MSYSVIPWNQGSSTCSGLCMWRSAGQIPQWLHWIFFTAACIAYTLYSLCLDYESAWYGRGFHGNVVDRFKGRTHISSWSNTRGKLHKLCKEDLKRPGTEVLVVWLGQGRSSTAGKDHHQAQQYNSVKCTHSCRPAPWKELWDGWTVCHITATNFHVAS